MQGDSDSDGEGSRLEQIAIKGDVCGVGGQRAEGRSDFERALNYELWQRDGGEEKKQGGNKKR